MKKEFACLKRPWKSTNNASNVLIIFPNGTLSSGLRLHKRSGILFMTDYLGCRGGTTSQPPDLAAGRRVRFCRPRSSVRRHDGAGGAHRLSQRTRDTAWFSPTLSEGISAPEPKGSCRRRGDHPTSQGRAQVGQTVSFVRQAEKRERSPAEKDNRADTGVDPRSQWGGGDRGAEHRPSAEVSLPEALADEAGGRNVDPADYAVDEHGSSSQGEDRARWHHAGACNRTQQSRQEGGVWAEVFDQPDRRGYVFGKLVARLPQFTLLLPEFLPQATG